VTQRPITRRLRGFLAFLADFVIGDDWRLAAAVGAALALTYGVHQLGWPAWWVLPSTVALALPYSLWRTVRHPGE
jgi:hypothetical protein